MEKRILKFRVMDTDFNQMCQVSSISFGDNDQPEKAEARGLTSPFGYRNIDLKKSDLLQFTGHVDTDKNEVYVGDIYEYDYEYDSDYDGDMPIVKRTAGRDYIKHLSDTGTIRTAKSEGGKVKVIGNIHSNPDLLPSNLAIDKNK